MTCSPIARSSVDRSPGSMAGVVAVEPNIRASDADRERLAAELGEHVAAGRLTLDEFDTRTQQAYAARTMGDLATLTADLPVPSAEPVAASGRWASPAVWYAIAAVVVLTVVLSVVGLAVGPAMAHGMGMGDMAGMMGGTTGGCR